jgi:hypothetical protein
LVCLGARSYSVMHGLNAEAGYGNGCRYVFSGVARTL